MIPVRKLAYQLLLQLDCTSIPPDRLLRITFGRHSEMGEVDRALLSQLVYGVLRWRKRLDWYIDQLSKIRPDKISPEVRTLLRLGLYQILLLDRIPNYAAVNETVEIAKNSQPKHVVKFINAVLRNAIRRHPDWKWPSAEADPATYLAITTSHPIWFAQIMIERLGYEETRLLCEANNRIAPLTLRINVLKTDPSQVAWSLRQSGFDLEYSPYLPTAIRLISPHQDISRHESYRCGWIQVQDEASQLIGYLVDPGRGERVLDICAGFGGKATHLAILMEDEGEVVAVDQYGWKLEELGENATRQGITIIKTISEDVFNLSPTKIGVFDRVLVDAPCSGFGVVRRNPDIKWRRKARDLYSLSRIQKALLQHAAAFVKKGGILVYATCTVFKEENEAVAMWFQDSFRWPLEPAEKRIPDTCWGMVDGPYFRTYPHRHDVDGFFAVCWRNPS